MNKKRFQLSGLWQHTDFLRLWSGQTVSLFGSQVSELAIPLLAAEILQANVLQMGLLNAFNYVPALLFGLFAGIWVDRSQRKPLLILSDLARAALIGAIPLLFLLGFLRMEWLLLITFLAACFNFLFNVAWHAILPQMVQKERLTDANAKLEVSNTAALIGGPGLAGGLIAWLKAPLAMLADALSFLLSALLLSGMHVDETPRQNLQKENKRQAFFAGVHLIMQSKWLKPIAFSSMTLNFSGGIFNAALILFITRVLGQDALFIGLMYGLGALSGLFGALLSSRITSRLGYGRTIIAASILIGTGWSFIPLSAGLTGHANWMVLCGMLIAGFGNTTYNIHITSLAQTIVPIDKMGRYQAAMQLFGLGLLPLGSLIGGGLGLLVPLQTVLLIGGGLMLTAFLWTGLSPLRRLKALSEANIETIK